MQEIRIVKLTYHDTKEPQLGNIAPGLFIVRIGFILLGYYD